MFGFINKKKLKQKIEVLKQKNRKEKIYTKYSQPISKEQEILNAYSQGYEDGTDNCCNYLMEEINNGYGKINNN